MTHFKLNLILQKKMYTENFNIDLIMYPICLWVVIYGKKAWHVQLIELFLNCRKQDDIYILFTYQ